MSKFIAASRQAIEIDKTGIQFETRIQEVKDDYKSWAEVAAKATDETKELKNLVKELKADIVEKDTRLDHLHKRNDKLSTLLENAKKDVVVEFRASKQFTDLLDMNYVVDFEDFRMDAMECFPEVDFSPLSSTLVLQALSSKQVLKMLTLRTMLPPSLPMTSLELEITPHNRNEKFCCLSLSFFTIFYEVHCFGPFEFI